MARYQLRFFFDYGAGGCLWAMNEASYQKFGFGPLDAMNFDLEGNKIDGPRISLPHSVQEKILVLDQLFLESLDRNYPQGPSLWNKEQWDYFQAQTIMLHREISNYLGSDFEILYMQNRYDN